jgi:hypothetical protein
VRNAAERWVAFVCFLAAGVFGLVTYGEAPFAPFGLTFVVLGTCGLAGVGLSALWALWENRRPPEREEPKAACDSPTDRVD